MVVISPLSPAVAVVVAFFLCWAPFHAQRLMAVYGSSYDVDQLKIYGLLNQFSGILYFLSTCINPLLYNIMSHKFRDAFKVINEIGPPFLALTSPRPNRFIVQFNFLSPRRLVEHTLNLLIGEIAQRNDHYRGWKRSSHLAFSR